MAIPVLVPALRGAAAMAARSAACPWTSPIKKTSVFQGAVSKGVVSRAWRKAKVDWDTLVARNLANEDIVRLILNGTVIKTRLDRKATNISVLAAIGVRRDGQKVLLSIKGEADQKARHWRLFPLNGR